MKKYKILLNRAVKEREYQETNQIWKSRDTTNEDRQMHCLRTTARVIKRTAPRCFSFHPNIKHFIVTSWEGKTIGMYLYDTLLNVLSVISTNWHSAFVESLRFKKKSK